MAPNCPKRPLPVRKPTSTKSSLWFTVVIYFLFMWQDSVRREISKRRGGGFSIIVIIIVAFIGIFLGYLMKS
jgi:hypothetical protein